MFVSDRYMEGEKRFKVESENENFRGVGGQK